jgi:hypothetical protein
MALRNIILGLSNILLKKTSDDRSTAERVARVPSRNDAIIGSVVQAPSNTRNADGSPALVPPLAYQPAANPAVVNAAQLVAPRVASGTSGGHHKRTALVAVTSGQQPPSVKPRTSDDLVSAFSEIQAQDAQNRSPASSFIWSHFLC